MPHIFVGKLNIINSENGLSPSRQQAIIWTNAGLLSVGTLRTYFGEILIIIQQFSLKKMHLIMSSAKRCLCCLGPNVLMRHNGQHTHDLQIRIFNPVLYINLLSDKHYNKCVSSWVRVRFLSVAEQCINQREMTLPMYRTFSSACFGYYRDTDSSRGYPAKRALSAMRKHDG